MNDPLQEIPKLNSISCLIGHEIHLMKMMAPIVSRIRTQVRIQFKQQIFTRLLPHMIIVQMSYVRARLWYGLPKFNSQNGCATSAHCRSNITDNIKYLGRKYTTDDNICRRIQTNLSVSDP